MLIFFDMDGTLFEEHDPWGLLHKAYGTLEIGRAATRQWYHTDFDKLVGIVIHDLWKGKPEQPYLDLAKNTRYNPGVQETLAELKRRGHKLAIISSGSSLLLERAMKELQLDYGIANTLHREEGIITGKSILDGKTFFPVRSDNKGLFVKQFCKEAKIPETETMAVGDGRNDIPLFKAVKTSFAYNTDKEEVIAAATHHIKDFREILEYC